MWDFSLASFIVPKPLSSVAGHAQSLSFTDLALVIKLWKFSTAPLSLLGATWRTLFVELEATQLGSYKVALAGKDMLSCSSVVMALGLLLLTQAT